MRVEPTECTPEFDPAKAPRLDPGVWPEARILKASANYAADYAVHTIEGLQRIVGTPAACQLIEQAMRLLAVQTIRQYVRLSNVTDSGADGLAQLFVSVLRAFRNECAIERSAEATRIRFRSFAPFATVATERVRQSLFEFVSMGVRVLNGRVSTSRQFDANSGVECWTFTNEKKWLW